MTDGLDDVYGGSLALLTDLYQLTMACGYWKGGDADREAVFHLTFRRAPFGGGFAIAAGLAPAMAFLQRLRWQDDDLAYLATLRDSEKQPLFPQGFLDYLRDVRFSCTVDAVPEGSLVFAHEPILRVTGPIAQAQIVETALLTLMNFQTLIATKAARVCQAARGAPVVEFGLRRAQGIDGGIGASRAAYIGGVAGTSNVLAGKLLGIRVMGTHAHSWVMFHGDELAAFRAYAEALPGNCTFLVDTYDTLEGVRNAITVGKELRARGHELAGVRLDSGDLAHLSIEARRLLDEAGFPDARIVASNDLDEHLIGSILEQGARIDTFGVGTKLVTAFDQPALGGVYKLGAYRNGEGRWHDAIKLSEQPIKISNPGVLGVKRLRRDGDGPPARAHRPGAPAARGRRHPDRRSAAPPHPARVPPGARADATPPRDPQRAPPAGGAQPARPAGRAVPGRTRAHAPRGARPRIRRRRGGVRRAGRGVARAR